MVSNPRRYNDLAFADIVFGNPQPAAFREIPVVKLAVDRECSTQQPRLAGDVMKEIL